MRVDHFPADVGKPDPGLRLPAGHLAAAHLVDQRDGGDVTSQGDDVEPQPLLLGARPGRTGDTKGVDAVETVAMLEVGEADGMRAVPEGGVERLDVLVDQRLLVALE